jgi:cell division protein FtsW (lipid II flippase)
LPRPLLACAPLPALFMGVVVMHQLGVGAVARGSNIAAAAVGLLLCASSRVLPQRAAPAIPLLAAIGGIGAVLLPFLSEGLLGVHRWVPVGGFRLHAGAVVAPILIVCIAVVARRQSVASTVIAVVSTTVLALQPDAAQATSLAVASAIILTRELRRRTHVMTGLALLLGASVLAFAQDDALPPVRHVEGIFGAVVSMGTAWAVGGGLSLLLLPLPFFVLWAYSRSTVPLALGAYIALTVLAPAWGTFPVPVMGYGVSPILGYFLALAFCYRATRP